VLGAELATVDHLIAMLGHPAYAWPLVIPLGLVGVAAGRLWADTLRRSQLGAALDITTGMAVVLTLSVFASASRILTLAGGAPWLGVVVCAILMLGLGFALGAPLTAILRLVGQAHAGEGGSDGPMVAWCWGLHLGGWALGTALGALLARYLGVQSLLLVAALGLVSAAVLAGLARKASAPRAPEARVGAEAPMPGA
jgi:predicted MFS family arabinose efflux permease